MEHEKRKKKKIVLFVSVLIIIVSLAFVFYQFIRNSQGRPENVAASFVEAMARNDYEKAKSFVATEEQVEIETWIREHEVFSCNYLKMSDSVGYSKNETRSRWNYIASIYCDDSDKLYCFGIADIVIEEVDNRWIITDWGNVCEIKNYCVECKYR